MSQKARITYRFDQPSGKLVQPADDRATGVVRDASASRRVDVRSAAEPKYQEPVSTATPQRTEPSTRPLFQEPLAFTREQDLPSWVSPFQDDAFALERLIRESGPVSERQAIDPAIGASQPDLQRADELPYIELGETTAPMQAEREVERFTEQPVKRLSEHSVERFAERPAPLLSHDQGPPLHQEPSIIRRHPVGPSWLKVFVSVTGAIATGVLFGYLALSLFTGEPATPATTDETSVVQPSGGTAGETPSGGAVMTEAEVPSGNYYMLQYGVFSNEEGMAAAIAELRQKGLAAASSTTDGYRVFAGMGTSRNSAVMLSEQLGGAEVYLKEFAVPAVGKLPFQGQSGQAELFFEQTRELIRLFNELTLSQLAQAEPARLPERDALAWKSAHQQWTATAAAIFKDWSPEAQETAEALVTRLQTAAVSFEEYDKNPSRAHLWTAQSALMEAVILQKDWLTQIDALS
ncbi:hypothetical protein PA598K_02247 [Paenibacillus sp. 598K]|uniref:SPOR domain-containing protein n=1 Tax=Paenibacillus sp. 598K TaxID=1117987 RepID=UPI000FF99220|nr:SPOR domain-containing protein [Paenibacillus sp. 598K]GBF73922.1 hypothetical protein PA598K_02247 [Paenibacillus sp. 598K]